MILKVRLEAMLKNKKKLYSKAKFVRERFKLAERYFYFLKTRTSLNEVDRRKLKFKI